MSWTRPQDLKAQLLRLWERGDLLREAVAATSGFPLRLKLKGPSPADLTTRFDAVRAWAEELGSVTHCRIERLERRHRVQGSQSLPDKAWLDTVEDALLWLGKRREWQRFSALAAQTRKELPCLLPWLEKRPLQALELAEDWPRLLAVVAWRLKHPSPGIYLRQVDIPGVHTKFIESRRGVLAELLDLALPAEEIDATKTGAGQFAGRYGFRDKPLRIRFRLLDPALRQIAALEQPDVTMDAASFHRLDLGDIRVFITENSTNFLAFPAMRRSIVIFGGGYGWEAMADSPWLSRCPIYYWGDIDTHGFAILDTLRSHFPHVVSLLMDRATLEAHRAFWGSEEKPELADLPRLTAEEGAVYDDLRDQRLRAGLRLEQEFIGYRWVLDHLEQLSSGT